MATPGFSLQDDYREYKAATASFIQELLARNRDCKKPWRITPQEGTKDGYALLIGEIRPLAEHVVGASCSAGPVPEHVLQSLRRAIDLRERCSSWYRIQAITVPSLKASNERHDYFTFVLEEAFKTLWPHRDHQGETINDEEALSQDREESEFKDQSPSQESMGHVERVDSKEGSHPSVQGSSASVSMPSKNQIKRLKKLKVLDEDPTIALFSLLQATKGLNETVQDVWKRYLSGQISLVVASTMMDMAINLVQRMETAYLVNFPQLAHWEAVMDALLPNLGKFATELMKVYEPAKEELLLTTFYLPYELLSWFRKPKPQNTTHGLVLRQVPFRRWSGSKITSQEIWRDSQIILHELLSEMLMFLDQERDKKFYLPTEDQITRGIREFLSGEEIGLWLLFGLQAFLDAQYILGKDAVRGFRELAATAESTRATKEDYISYSQVIHDVIYTNDQLDRYRDTIERYGSWTKTDHFQVVRSSQPGAVTGRPYHYISHSTVLCGCFQFSLLLQAQDLAVQDINKYGFVLSMAYLYNALRIEGLLTGQWQDMEDFLALHGEEGVFLGEAPKTLNAHHTHLKLITGTSVTELAAEGPRKSSGNTGVRKNTKGQRVIKVPDILATFNQVLCNLKAKEDVMNHIEAALQRRADTERSRVQKKQNDPPAEQWHKTHTLTPVQLLAVLEEALIAEEPKLTFPYHFLHRTCWRLLRDIEYTMHDTFLQWLKDTFNGAAPKNVNPSLKTLPQCIFGVRPTERRDSLRKAGTVVQNFLNSGGGSRSMPTAGVPDDSDVEELGPTTLWGILEPGHPTWRGKCIHWGHCSRHV